MCRLALIIRACLALMGIFKSSEFAGVGSAVTVGFDYQGVACMCVLPSISKTSEFAGLLSWLALIILAWLVSEWISKSSELAGIGSAAEVGYHYRNLACIRMDC